MNRELELRLQSWVDGELPEREARKVTTLLESDPIARALVAELRMTKGFLAGNEPEVTLAESRDFYWSKIRHEIARSVQKEAVPERARWIVAWHRLFRLLAPVSGVALVIFAAAVSTRFSQPRAVDNALANLVEVENPSEHIGSISYRSQADNMFVVWLYDKESETDVKSDMPELMDDMTIQ